MFAAVVDIALAGSLDAPLQQDNVAHAPRSIALAPTFPTPFPRRVEGVLFDGRVLPCLGFWMALPDGVRSTLTAQARPLWHRGPDDFAVLLSPEYGRRVVVACIPGASTLAAAHARIARALERAGSFWRRRLTFGRRDVLKIPELSLRGEAATTRVSVELHAGYDHDFPEEITLGRGEAYDRSFVADRPFILWSAPPGAARPDLVAWLPRP